MLSAEDIGTVEITLWTARSAGIDGGISASSVRRINLSNDPRFVAKLRDVVGAHVYPPAHAIVLSIDEKSQTQALDRTQPGLPL